MNNFYQETSNGLKLSGLSKTLLSIVCGIILFFTIIGVERIDAGHVGLKVNMTGGNQGVGHTEYVTGWCFYWRLAQKVYEFPTYQQHKEYEAYTVPAKGGTIFTVHPTFNYNLNSGEVAKMFQTFRLPLGILETGYLQTSMSTTIREVTNTFATDSILNNQGGYDAAILDKLNKTLAPYFHVTQFTANLKPDDKLKDAIIDKARHVQEAQAKLAEIQVADATSKVDLINAKKDSAVRVTRAKGEAEAIRVTQEVLKQSPQYVELRKVEKWNGAYPNVVAGSGTGMLIQLPQSKQ